MNTIKFGNVTIDTLAGKLTAFIAGVSKSDEAVPCVLTLGAGNMSGHVVNTLAVCVHGYKFQFVFLNKEGIIKDLKPAQIVLDSARLGSVLKGICMFKSDVDIKISVDGATLEVSNQHATHTVNALHKKIADFAEETMPRLQFAVDGEKMMTALRKGLSLDVQKTISMTLDYDGKLYVCTTDNNRIVYEKVDVDVNQNVLVFSAISKAISAKEGDIRKAFEEQNVEVLKSAFGADVVSAADGPFQMIRLTVGGQPLVALAYHEGKVLDDTKTFMSGSAEQKEQLMSVPAAQIEMQGVVAEFFNTFRCESYLSVKDARLLTSLFAGAEKVNFSVFGKTMMVAMDGLAVNIPFAERDIPELEALRNIACQDMELIAEVDNADLQVAISFLMETGSKKETAVPLCIQYEENSLKLSVMSDSNGSVEVPLKNSIPEGTEPAYINAKFLKAALGNTEKGTVALSKKGTRQGNIFSLSGIVNEQPDKEHSFIILGINMAKFAKGANIEEENSADEAESSSKE